MGTFQEDLDSDRDDVFLDTTEYAETVTYRAKGQATTSSITAFPIDRPDSNRAENRSWGISADDVAAPTRGDQVTDSDSKVFTVVNVSMDELGMIIVDCAVGIEEG